MQSLTKCQLYKKEQTENIMNHIKSETDSRGLITEQYIKFDCFFNIHDTKQLELQSITQSNSCVNIKFIILHGFKATHTLTSTEKGSDVQPPTLNRYLTTAPCNFQRKKKMKKTA